MILKAQQDYSKLILANTKSLAEKEAANALFYEIFPEGDVESLSSLNTKNVLQGKKAINSMFKKSSILKAQELLISSLMNEYKTLKSQKKASKDVGSALFILKEHKRLLEKIFL